MIKKHVFIIALFTAIITAFSSCEIVGGIFKTGVGVGIFLVVIVIAIIVFIVSRTGKK